MTASQLVTGFERAATNPNFFRLLSLFILEGKYFREKKC